MAKKICIVCGKELGFMGKTKVKDGFICDDCLKTLHVSSKDRIVMSGTLTLQEIKDYVQKRDAKEAEITNFAPTSEITEMAKFNDTKREMLLSSTAHIKYKPSHYTLFTYDQIVDYEILENGATIAKGGLGRAAVGGLLFGGAGAIVGAATRKHTAVCKQLQIKITVKDFHAPAFYMTLINTEVKKDGFIYKTESKFSEDIAAKLQLIIDENAKLDQQKQTDTDHNPSDAADEIRKFKQLCDDGIITKEEFEQKKKQLLNL